MEKIKTPYAGRVFFVTIFMLLALSPSCDNASESRGVIEIGLVCSDLDKSLDFYKNIIGMADAGGFEVEGQLGADLGLSDGRPFTIKKLKMIDSPTATILKLAHCTGVPDSLRLAYVHDAPGVQYLSIEVASTKPIKERLLKNGIKLLGKTPVSMGEGREFVMVQDPDGVFVEIVGSAD